MSDLQTPLVVSFFLSGSLTDALFRWLSFQRFVQQGERLSLDSGQTCPQQPLEWLQLWQTRQATDPRLPTAIWPPVWLLGAALMGIVTMLGMMAVTLGQPVNIWLPLLLFALLPLVLSLTTLLLQWLPLSPNTQSWLPAVWQRLLSSDTSWHWCRESPRLLNPWLQWQLQRAASLFMLCAMLTFFVVALFQDIRFVWSSTFIQQDATMLAVFEVLCWPWSWALPAPSLEAVQASRLGMDYQPLAEPLWPLVVMSILFYGLLPRLLLMGMFRRQLRSRLVWAVQESGRVEAFLNLQQLERSQNALVVEAETPTLEVESVEHPQGSQVGWRLMDDTESLSWNLGMGDWQDDEHWLTSEQSHLAAPVQILVTFWQTPTGEMEDCLLMLKDNNPDMSLVLLQAQDETERDQAQLRTWQYFAEKCQLPLRTEATL